MRKFLLAAVALGGLSALTATAASAAPLGTGVHVTPSQPMVTDVQYWWRHHHYHHRHWRHGGWRYW